MCETGLLKGIRHNSGADFDYDKSAKTLYNIHMIEIKDIICIHLGRENGMAAILLR